MKGMDDEAPRSGRGGRRFKSCHSDQHLTGFLAAMGPGMGPGWCARYSPSPRRMKITTDVGDARQVVTTAAKARRRSFHTTICGVSSALSAWYRFLKMLIGLEGAHVF
jgi:hypothetical protein